MFLKYILFLKFLNMIKHTIAKYGVYIRRERHIWINKMSSNPNRAENILQYIIGILLRFEKSKGVETKSVSICNV